VGEDAGEGGDDADVLDGLAAAFSVDFEPCPGRVGEGMQPVQDAADFEPGLVGVAGRGGSECLFGGGFERVAGQGGQLSDGVFAW
jgi:hypothetical protein